MRIHSLLIPSIISISTFVILMFLSFNFDIKPGAYSFVEGDKLLTVSKGVINTQNFDIITESNSLKIALITDAIKNIDISWVVCLLMLSYLVFIISLTKCKTVSMKKHWVSIVVATLFIAANLVRISQNLSYLSGIIK